jgi:hypothetical protein
VTYFNALQLLVATTALWLGARTLRVLLFQAPLDTRAFLTALAPALEAHQLELARSLAQACLPAWGARLALHGVTELEGGQDPRVALEEARADLELGLGQGRDALVVLGRMASPLAFIGVIVETGKALGGGEGLVALQRGLPVTIALQRSLLTFAIGVATTIACFTAAGIARRQAQALGRDLERVAGVISRAGAARAPM